MEVLIIEIKAEDIKTKQTVLNSEDIDKYVNSYVNKDVYKIFQKKNNYRLKGSYRSQLKQIIQDFINDDINSNETKFNEVTLTSNKSERKFTNKTEKNIVDNKEDDTYSVYSTKNNKMDSTPLSFRRKKMKPTTDWKEHNAKLPY